MQGTIHSIALFGWQKFQPKMAPAAEFFTTSSIERHLSKKDRDEPISAKEQSWDQLLTKYNFTRMDEVDWELLRFVNSGILNQHQLKSLLENLRDQIASGEMRRSLDLAWRPFHDSFQDNPKEVAASIIDGTKTNAAIVSISNLDEAVRVLKQLGFANEALELIEYFEEQQEPSFWTTERGPFDRGPYDAAIEVIVAREKAAAKTPFVFEPALLEAAKNYNRETIGFLATVSVDDYYELLKSKRGDELRNAVLSGLEFRRISNASPEMLEVVGRMESALRRLASEGDLNALRVAKYGLKPDSASDDVKQTGAS